MSFFCKLSLLFLLHIIANDRETMHPDMSTEREHLLFIRYNGHGDNMCEDRQSSHGDRREL